MNLRIEKKLSKRLKEILVRSPVPEPWFCNEWERDKGGTTTMWVIGGGTDYWGESKDIYSVVDWFEENAGWVDPVVTFVEDHPWPVYHPKLYATGQRLIAAAKRIAAEAATKQ